MREKTEGAERKVSRRKWLMGGGAFAACAAGAVVLDDRWDLKLKRVTVELERLPPTFDGFTIAHLTDLHLGHRVPIDFIEKAVALAKSVSPDLVALTGDFISNDVSLASECTTALAALEAPHGVVGVLGNHDHWCDAFTITREFESVGIEMLANKSRLVQQDGAAVRIAGIDDAVTGNQDIDAAIGPAGEQPDMPTVLLMHRPEEMVDAADRDVDLVLAGHTHGGQVVVPFYGAPVIPSDVHRRFAYGLERVRKGSRTQIYVSSGVGMAIMKLRINCRPEVAVITLSGKRP